MREKKFEDISEKDLKKIMEKIRSGRAVLVKNISCERENVKLYRLKDGETLLVDKELDVKLLDNMNANKNIEVETVCSGHTEKGEFPTVGFNYKGKMSIEDVKKTLSKIPNTHIMYDKQLSRMVKPLKNEFKIKKNGEEYMLCNIEETLEDYFFITSAKKGTKTWWNKLSNTLSTLK